MNNKGVSTELYATREKQWRSASNVTRVLLKARHASLDFFFIYLFSVAPFGRNRLEHKSVGADQGCIVFWVVFFLSLSRWKCRISMNIVFCKVL